MYLGVDIAKILNNELGPITNDVTLNVRTPGARTPGSLTGGTNPSTTSYAGNGFAEEYTDDQIDGTLVQVDDRKIVFFSESLPAGIEPKTGDTVTFESSTYSVIRVNQDPAKALYACQVRGASA